MERICPYNDRRTPRAAGHFVLGGGRNAERRNADSYCPISGGMPKTEGGRNESLSVAKSQVPLIVSVKVCF